MFLIMDSQSASERLVTTKLASKHNIRRNQTVFPFKSIYIKLIGSLIFLPVCHFASLDVRGQLHEDVLLPCTVKYKDEFDYNELVVHWQRPVNDVVVHTFFYGLSQPDYQVDQYRGRTEMFYDLLPLGNLSLLLKNLSKSDAGTYTCNSILKEPSGFIIKYVNLIVEERSEDEIQNPNRLFPTKIIVCIISLGITVGLCLFLCFIKKPKTDGTDEEKAGILQGFEIQDYREHIRLLHKDYSVFPRQLLVKQRRSVEAETYLLETSETINAEELFTLENPQFVSRRMVLVGDAGAGKSYFCRWLQNKWIQEKNMMYTCILYVSCNKIKDKKSLKEICDTIFKDLSSVLSMDKVLLIFDELDDLVCENQNLSSTQEVDINTPLKVYTLVENIMKKQLIPDTDVLIVCRYDSFNDMQKKCDSRFILLDFTEEQTKNTYNTITAKKQKSANTYKKISDITYIPAFVVLMSHLSTNHNLEADEDSSPYKCLTEVLLKWTKKSRDRKNSFTNIARQSYENLTKGEQNSTESMKFWKTFLHEYNCPENHEYQCNMLRDMLAAAYCVWETYRTGGLIDCLNFWVFGNNTIVHSDTNILLKSIAEEHNAKFYHFIRFFMRLLKYPDYDSLCNNTPMNNNSQELLTCWFKESFFKYHQHSEKLKLIHCIFELHNEKVTRDALSTTEKLEFFNTPLNFKDIQALEYCFRDTVLAEVDLRLCALEDKYVNQLRSIIKNTKNVMLSSNHLTIESGKFLGEILEEPNCMIEKLSLGTNQLGAHGAQHLWKALQHNKTLTGLYIYHNDITDEGMHGIVEYLHENHSLKELHLCGNTFGNDGFANIQKLKDTKKELEVVLWIAENLELFQYVENKVSDLNLTWNCYHSKYLYNLLGAVQKNLEKKDCNKDPQITWERVDTLIQDIDKVLKQEKR